MLAVVSIEAAAGTETGRRYDFHHTQEGEPLTLPSFVCEGSQEGRDKCGCGRAFTGTQSGVACTVGVVDNVDEEDAVDGLLNGPLGESWGPDLHDALEADFRQLCDAVVEAGLKPGQVVRIESQPNTWALVEVVGKRVSVHA